MGCGASSAASDPAGSAEERGGVINAEGGAPTQTRQTTDAQGTSSPPAPAVRPASPVAAAAPAPVASSASPPAAAAAAAAPPAVPVTDKNAPRADETTKAEEKDVGKPVPTVATVAPEKAPQPAGAAEDAAAADDEAQAEAAAEKKANAARKEATDKEEANTKAEKKDVGKPVPMAAAVAPEKAQQSEGAAADDDDAQAKAVAEKKHDAPSKEATDKEEADKRAAIEKAAADKAAADKAAADERVAAEKAAAAAAVQAAAATKASEEAAAAAAAKKKADAQAAHTAAEEASAKEASKVAASKAAAVAEARSAEEEKTAAAKAVVADKPAAEKQAADGKTAAAAPAATASSTPAASAAAAVASAPPASKTAPVLKPMAVKQDELSSEIAGCDESLLFVLKLDTSATAEQLAVVHEMQPAHHYTAISAPDGPGALDARVGALSWRWDIAKPATLEEAVKLPPSKKIVEAIKRGRAMGLKWMWIDWCVVPQYSELTVILNHVRASRFIYEKCSMILVDTVEVAPGMGLFIPTKEYMSRLWTTAEMSSMLANASVHYGTFVQLRRWHWKSILLAADAPFSAVMVRQNFLKEYYKFFADEVEVDKPCSTFHFHQYRLHALVYNTAATQMRAKYGPHLCDWMVSNNDKLQVMAVSPLKLGDEEKLIDEFAKKYDWDARKSPHCKPIFDAVAKSKRMPNAFDQEKHYKGFLLLAADAMRMLLNDWQFNGGAYKSVLQRLHVRIPGSTPLDAKTTLPSEGALQCFLESDVVKVREMVMAARGRVQHPISLPGVTFVPVPMRMWLTERHRLDETLAKGAKYPQLGSLLPQCSLHTRTSLRNDVASLRTLFLALTFTAPGGASKPAVFQSSAVDAYGPHSVARFQVAHSEFGKNCNTPGAEAWMTLESNVAWIEPLVATTRVGYTLAEDEIWLQLDLRYSTSNSEQHALSLFRVAKAASVNPAALGALVTSFENYGTKEFQAKQLSEKARFAFLEDAKGTGATALATLVTKAGFVVGPALKEAEAPVDNRPEMTPADTKAQKGAAGKKDGLIKRLLAIPCVTGMWSMTAETLTMMPETILAGLLESAKMTQDSTDACDAAWPSEEEQAKKDKEREKQLAKERAFPGSETEYSGEEVAAIEKAVRSENRDDQLAALRTELAKQPTKSFHSLQHCRDVVGAFWREEERLAADMVEARWKGTKEEFLDAMREQMWGFDDAYPTPEKLGAEEAERAAAEANAFKGSEDEFSDAQVEEMVAAIKAVDQAEGLKALRAELAKHPVHKTFHSLQQCKDMVGAFWREKERAAADIVEMRWKGEKKPFLAAMKEQMWDYDVAYAKKKSKPAAAAGAAAADNKKAGTKKG